MDEVMETEDSPIQLSLSDFPDELLLKLMFHMNDTSLLNMTLTCHRFRAIAKEAFGRIYDGTHDFFNIKVLCENDIGDHKRYQPFFYTFGGNMQAIEITFDEFQPVDQNHWVYDSMGRYCCTSLKKLQISYGTEVNLTKILLQQPSLIGLTMHYNQSLNSFWTMYSFPNLKSFILNDAANQNQGHNLREFFNKNRQLTELSIEQGQENIHAFNIFDLLNGKLNELERLSASCDFLSPNLESKVIRLDKLDSVTLTGEYASYAIVEAISKGCENLTNLKIWSESSDIQWNEAVLSLCRLKKLTTLKINAHNIGVQHIQRITDNLPNLTKLHFYRISYKSTAFQSLPQIIPNGTNLVKVKMAVIEYDDFINVNCEFIKKMAEFTQRHDSLKVLLTSFREKLIFTRGEARRCNSIIYNCAKQDDDNIQSGLSLLDLSTACVEKIVGLLEAESQMALYNSCSKIQNIVKSYISDHVFHVKADIGENVWQSLGQHISRISVECRYSNDNLVLWRDINRYCSSITEIITTGWKLDTNSLATLVWPKVKKLIIKTRSKIGYQNLRSIVCPMLEYLEIRKLVDGGGAAAAVQAVDKFDHGDAYRQLTTLKFRCYNKAVVKFLLGLDDTICQQISALSLYNISDTEWKNSSRLSREQKRSISELINILIRFRNVTTLKVLVPGLYGVDTQYLFENCTKLIHFEFCHDMGEGDDIFKFLMANCKQIQFIRVIEPSCVNGYERQQFEKLQKLFPEIKVQIDKTRSFAME